MDVKKIAEVVRFSSERMEKVSLFGSPRMFCDIYCLEAGQKQKVHSHAANDKIYYVVQGEGSFTIGLETRLLTSGEITCAYAGEPHGVENTSAARLTCLVFMAPNPGRRSAPDADGREPIRGGPDALST